MLNIRSREPWIGSLLVVCAALAGCASKTNVAETANVPASYTHAFMTVQEVWFNTSATAVPADTTWVKFPLTTPVTVDLATSVSGTLNTIASGLVLPPGTYAQARLFAVDAGTALLSTASALGALFNSEVDYVDSTGASHQVALELQNPAEGIGLSTSLTITANTSGTLGGVGTTSDTTGTTTPTTTSDINSSTSAISTTDPFAGTVTSGTTGTTTTGTSSVSTGTTTIAAVTAAIDLDGARDLVPFLYGSTGVSVAGVLLNPHMSVFDTSTTGAITGTVDISGLTSNVSSSSNTSLVNIQVTAETLSADGSRHEQVNSTAVSSSGTFTLYPLASSTASPTSYDLVVHGPGIATIIVKGVTVTVGDPSTTTPASVSVTPRAATPFSVNLITTTPLTAGAIVGFYQTIPVAGEVPYLIEQAPIDPFNRNFASPEPLSSQTIDYGTWSSGTTVAVTAATPTEGASTYKVSATAPLFTDGALTTTVTAAGGSSTTVAVPTLTVASGETSVSVPFAITETTAKKYNAGQLIISKDGAIVAAADLATLLAGNSGTLTVPGIPAGTTSNLYYVSVRTWNTASPVTTLNREEYPTALDLRSGTGPSFSLSID
jgi:Domain of unknown function (DUF4382)